jgi:N-methylhydantoinase B
MTTPDSATPAQTVSENKMPRPDVPAYDPVRLELIRNGIGSVVDEMVLTMVRIAYSAIIRDTMDLSSAFCDRQGRVVAQGVSIPLHLGSFPDALEAVLKKFGDDLGPGDVIVMNDPYHGGMHLPDIFLVKPVFVEARMLGFAIVVAHHSDVGGRVPGSTAIDSTEIFQEGLRLPPVKLYHRGVRNEGLFDVMALNSRTPDILKGDLQGQLSAFWIVERGMAQLARHYGIDELECYFQHLLDYSEREARRNIRAMPDGVYRFTDYLDDDGVTLNKPIQVCVKVEIAGDRLSVDFEGTSPQVAGAVNATFSFAKSACYYALRTVMETDAPPNSGLFNAIEVRAPYGSVCNPKPPGACGSRAVTGYRMIDALYGALAQAVPHRVRAAGEGGNTSWSMGYWDEEGEFGVFRDVIMGAWGGGWQREGVDGVANPAVNICNSPIELIENQVPVMIERYELVPDSGGPGKWRGGMGLERQVRFLTDARVLSRSDRRDHPAFGLMGGSTGGPALNHAGRAGEWTLLPTKFVRFFQNGDRFRHRMSGAGGYGSPLDRDAALVLDDVNNGKVTIEGAAHDYGVVVRGDPSLLDEQATARLRAERRERAPAAAPLMARTTAS